LVGVAWDSAGWSGICWLGGTAIFAANVLALVNLKPRLLYARTAAGMNRQDGMPLQTEEG